MTSSDPGSSAPWHLRAWQWVRRNVLRDRQRPVPLQSFRPSFDEEAHGSYVDLLVDEIRQDNPPRNVAVSGPYGSGKSSILLELRRRLGKDAVVEIELATVDRDTSAIVGAAKVERSGSVVTEALRKEIVKRLLYSAKPSRLPRSQLNRIRPFARARAAALSALLALGYLAAEWVYAIPGPAITWARTWKVPPFQLTEDWWLAAAYFADGALAFLLLLTAQWALSMVRIREVSVGEFKLSKDDPTQNFFDQYLDEIVYFFARTGKKVVVFEDLDRFKDRGIFIALRELNVLLNNSKAVPQTVTFVYATGDKVFVPRKRSDGPKGISAPGSDRAKFFDLIVPVVPFVSTETSGGLLRSQLAKTPEIEAPHAELIRLVGRYFPDMRAIVSLSNEYRIYFDRLIRRSGLELDESRLFSMISYKHAYPDDYDLIQFGSSKLDGLIATLDDLVLLRLAGIDREIRELKGDIAQQASQAARAEVAGRRLLNVLGVLVDSGRRSEISSVSFGANSYPLAETETLPFWQALDEDPTADLQVTFATGVTLDIKRAALASALSQDLPASLWITQAEATSENRLTRLVDLRRSLAHANLAERINNRAYIGQGLSTDGEKLIDVDFRHALRQAMKSDFVEELIASGYLDETYVLYGSVYEDSLVSIEAQNFRIQFVARRRSSPLYKLSRTDVAEVRAKAGDSFLDEPSVLNVSIFNYLLGGGALDPAIELIAEERLDEGQDFVATYLAQGTFAPLLARKLAPHAPWILRFIAERELTQEDIQLIFNAALLALDPNVEYTITAEARRLLEVAAASALGGFGKSLERQPARVLALLFVDAGVRVPDLEPWSEQARRAIAGEGVFDMTRGNVATITGDPNRLGLDSIARSRPVVLRQTLARLAEYLEVLEDSNRPSIDSDEDLPDLLRVIAEFGPSELSEVLLRAPSHYAIDDLVRFDGGGNEDLLASYPVLARYDFFDPSAANVYRYLEMTGTLDQSLEGFLERNRTLVDGASLSAEERATVARALSTSASLSPQVLSSVLASLEVTAIDPRGLQLERSATAKMLVRNGYLPLDNNTWSALGKSPWAVKEAILDGSETSAVLEIAFSPEDLEKVLASRVLDEELKRALISEPSQLAHVGTPAGASEAVRIAARALITLSSEQLAALIAAGASATSIVDYLATPDLAIDDRYLVSTLLTLAGDWAALVDKSSQWKNYPSSASLTSVLGRLRAMGYVSKYSTRGSTTRVSFAV